MEKMRLESPNIPARNVEKIAALFPHCVVETADENGNPKLGVDFEALRQTLGDDVATDGFEAFDFTWVGKRAARAEAHRPLRKTLRPCPEESKDWDSTENLYIEGDNLDVLKLLQENYLNKVKLIYIDPPYNTGNDFIYRDDFAMSEEEYDEETGSVDEETGKRLYKNTETNGRFHSDWCSMIYPRLLLARNLLAEDGVIFISIDGHENSNLRKIMEDVFGSKNFISEITILNNPRGRQSDAFFATVHEYLLCFAKNINKCSLNGAPLSEKQKSEYGSSDDQGAYRLLGLRQRGVASLREDRPDMFFPIYVSPDGKHVELVAKDGWFEVLPQKSDGRYGRWMWGKEKCLAERNRLVPKFIERRQEYDIFVKDYLVRDGDVRTRKFRTVWDDKQINNQVGTQEVKNLLQGDVMSFPKSTAYLETICLLGSSPDSIILDFFSGSATTAHAVMQLNAQDGGQRKFIMVQIQEPCAEKTEAFKAGYRNICEIGKERIRRAGEKIRQENALLANTLDVGFRVFKIDDSNMKDSYYADEISQSNLLDAVSNVKEDRSALDLFFGCLLDWGLPLSYPYVCEQIDGCDVHVYNGGGEDGLIACFDENVPESVVETIAKRKPLRAVFRDASFADSSAKINALEIFKRFNPENADDVANRVKVI